MRPIFAACYFGSGNHGAMYARLALVLEKTARRHCPDWDIRVEKIEPPPYSSAMHNESHVWNHQKLEWWIRVFEAAPDGAQVLMIDGDMVVLKPLDDVWARDFDIAYTARVRSRLPLNGGVVFLRVSDRTRAFMRAWWAADTRFLGDAAAHGPWRSKYAGINQASLGYLLEEVRHGCKLVKLPCPEWNCCEWDLFSPQTRILHVKSGLRRSIFHLCAPHARLLPLVKVWRALERDAGGAPLDLAATVPAAAQVRPGPVMRRARRV